MGNHKDHKSFNLLGLFIIPNLEVIRSFLRRDDGVPQASFQLIAGRFGNVASAAGGIRVLVVSFGIPLFGNFGS